MNNQAVVPFGFQVNKIRVITDEQGNPWFVAKERAEEIATSCMLFHSPEGFL